jgi:hypothetical protein
LVKSLSNFFQSDRYLTKSESLLSGEEKGIEFNVKIETNTLVQSGGKFRSEITFTQADESSKIKNLVVSNGQKVWIYRPDLKQYAVIPYADFQKSYEDSLLIGMSSWFFLEIPEADRKEISSNELSKEILKQIGVTNNSGIKKIDTTIVDGRNLSVYTYTDVKDGYSFSGFIEPNTAILQQLQIAGKSEGVKILMTEKIIERVANPMINAKTFQFIPPNGTKKVKSLSLSPF